MTPEWPSQRREPSRYTDTEWAERLRAATEASLAHRQARRDQRRQFAERRAHGLDARHATKLSRKDTTMPNDTTQITDEAIRAAVAVYLDHHGAANIVPEFTYAQIRGLTRAMIDAALPHISTTTVSASRHPSRQDRILATKAKHLDAGRQIADAHQLGQQIHDTIHDRLGTVDQVLGNREEDQ
jgi:hypothetical protein